MRATGLLSRVVITNWMHERPVRENVSARASWVEAVQTHQRPPSGSELDAWRDERHRRHSRAARAAAEAGGMTSLVAAMLSGTGQPSLGSVA